MADFATARAWAVLADADGQRSRCSGYLSVAAQTSNLIESLYVNANTWVTSLAALSNAKLVSWGVELIAVADAGGVGTSAIYPSASDKLYLEFTTGLQTVVSEIPAPIAAAINPDGVTVNTSNSQVSGYINVVKGATGLVSNAVQPVTAFVRGFRTSRKRTLRIPT